MELGNITIADLVKAGWSPADVKGIIELTAPTKPVPTEPIAQPQADKDKPEQKGEEVPAPPEKEKPDTDLEERIKALETKNNELLEQLTKAQAANVNRDHSDTPATDTPYDALIKKLIGAK